ncbi:MAG: SH3 domain-containing protein [Bacteroidota bacterium]
MGNHLHIEKVDTGYSIIFLDNDKQDSTIYTGEIKGQHLFYRDQFSLGKIIKIFKPKRMEEYVTSRHKWTFEDSSEVRLIIDGTGEYYLDFSREEARKTLPVEGIWRPLDWNYGVAKPEIQISSNEKGIEVIFKNPDDGNIYVFGDDTIFTEHNKFDPELFSVGLLGPDHIGYASYNEKTGNINLENTYYKKISNKGESNSYYWKNRTDFVSMVPNGPYFLVEYGGFKDYVFTVLMEKRSDGFYRIPVKESDQASIIKLDEFSLLLPGSDEPLIKPGSNSKQKSRVTINNLPLLNQPKRSRKRGVINDPDGYTNLRSGPGSSFPIKTKVYEGTTFEVIPTQKDWWEIRLANGTNGFMHKSRVKLIGT